MASVRLCLDFFSIFIFFSPSVKERELYVAMATIKDFGDIWTNRLNTEVS